MSNTPKVLPIYRKSHSPQLLSTKGSNSRAVLNNLNQIQIEAHPQNNQFVKLKTERSSRSNDPKKKISRQLKPMVLDPFKGKFSLNEAPNSTRTHLRQSRETVFPVASENNVGEQKQAESSKMEFRTRSIQKMEYVLRRANFKIRKTSLSAPRNTSQEKSSSDSRDNSNRETTHKDGNRVDEKSAIANLFPKFFQPKQDSHYKNSNRDSKQQPDNRSSLRRQVGSTKQLIKIQKLRDAGAKGLTKKQLFDKATMKGMYKYRQNNRVLVGSENPDEQANQYLQYWAQVQQSQILAKEQSPSKQYQSSCQLLKMF